MGRAALAYDYLTIDQYLDQERLSVTKNEYFKGKIVAMAGASPAHNRITRNLLVLLAAKLKGKPCEPFGSDQRLFVEETQSYHYPDLSVACKPIQFNNDKPQALTNPVMLCEVLSETTASYDLAIKREKYQTILSLKEIVFIDSVRVLAQVYRRSESGWMVAGTFTEPDEVVELETVQLKFSLADVYDSLMEEWGLRE